MRLLTAADFPNLVAEVSDPGAYEPNNADKVGCERRMNQLLLEPAAGDKFCPTQLRRALHWPA